MNQRKKKDIKVEAKKLGRRRYKGYQIIGWAEEGTNKIEIDSRLKKLQRLQTIIHEILHLAFPAASESEILKAEKMIGNTLWKQGYRRTET